MKGIKKAVALLGGQTDTGDLLGVPQQYVSAWVNKGKKAPAKYIRKIAELTEHEVTVDQLLAEHEDQSMKGA